MISQRDMLILLRFGRRYISSKESQLYVDQRDICKSPEGTREPETAEVTSAVCEVPIDDRTGTGSCNGSKKRWDECAREETDRRNHGYQVKPEIRLGQHKMKLQCCMTVITAVSQTFKYLKH